MQLFPPVRIMIFLLRPLSKHQWWACRRMSTTWHGPPVFARNVYTNCKMELLLWKFLPFPFVIYYLRDVLTMQLIGWLVFSCLARQVKQILLPISWQVVRILVDAIYQSTIHYPPVFDVDSENFLFPLFIRIISFFQ